MVGYLDLEGGELRRSIFLVAKTFNTHLRKIELDKENILSYSPLYQ